MFHNRHALVLDMSLAVVIGPFRVLRAAGSVTKA